MTLQQTADALFSQCLAALATSFAHLLMAAARQRLNPLKQYGVANADASKRWLQLIATRGVLLHLQAIMRVEEVGTLTPDL